MEKKPMIRNAVSEETAHTWPVMPAALALAGIIAFIFATFGPPASSSGFVSLLKGFLGPILPDYIARKEHYRIIPGPGSWLFAFVLGMAAGGFLGGLTLGKPIQNVPALWERRFGARPALRYAVSFLGGFLILFGARLAGGCTLGLFISGSTQLAVSGLYFGAVIFVVAMITARLVYGSPKGGKK